MYAHNGEEIKKSAPKLELTFPVDLEKSAAEEEVKKALAAAGKTLDELKGKIAGDEFYAEDSFTKVVIGFSNVAIRKDAQAVICTNFTNGTWKGSKLTRPNGGAIWIRVQKPPFARRRDARLNAFQRALMATTSSKDKKDYPIDWAARTISHDGKVVAEQEKFGTWVVKDKLATI